MSLPPIVKEQLTSICCMPGASRTELVSPTPFTFTPLTLKMLTSFPRGARTLKKLLAVPPVVSTTPPGAPSVAEPGNCPVEAQANKVAAKADATESLQILLRIRLLLTPEISDVQRVRRNETLEVMQLRREQVATLEVVPHGQAPSNAHNRKRHERDS